MKSGIRFDVVGRSAGAMNAVLLASGLLEGGPDAAKRKLARFWRGLSDAGPSPGWRSTRRSSCRASWCRPICLNPLGLNPLRDLLLAEVDFERLRAERPLRLLIAATRVRDGRLRLFREDEITLEAVLASCCLPRLHHAVEIDGEAYWDGGFSANPPLRQLAMETSAEDILLVQLLPEQGASAVPRNGKEITETLSKLAFREPLLKELEALEDLRTLCSAQKLLPSKQCRKILRLRLHRLAAEDAVPGVASESPLHVDWPLLTRLHAAGAEAASRWLAGYERS